jgi:hypothetical protein
MSRFKKRLNSPKNARLLGSFGDYLGFSSALIRLGSALSLTKNTPPYRVPSSGASIDFSDYPTAYRLRGPKLPNVEGTRYGNPFKR